jgi:hypothetical protein
MQDRHSLVVEKEEHEEEDSVQKNALSQTANLGQGPKAAQNVNFYNTTSFPGRVVKRSSFGGTIISVRGGGGGGVSASANGEAENNENDDLEKSKLKV